jgi:hypothetical protein
MRRKIVNKILQYVLNSIQKFDDKYEAGGS